VIRVNDKNLADWLVSEANKRHWSLREVSREAKLSQTTVSKIANGERTKLKLETWQALAVAFNLPVEDVMRQAGFLTTPNGRPVRERVRVVYEVNEDDLVLRLWRALSPDDQRIVRDLMERLVPENQARIVGDE
jgi:transcriptional regulator with XRE-family HTH domain